MNFMKSSGILPFIFLCIGIAGCSEKPQVVAPTPPEVVVSQALKKQVTNSLEFTGTTAPLEFVEIRARVEGWLESIHFITGSRVQKGDLLFVIDPRPFQAQVDQSEAALKGKEADLQLKEANLKRASQLLSSASISQLQFDIENANATVALAQVGIAKANLEKARLDLSFAKLTAPIAGRVGRNYVDIGNLVGAKDRTLLTEIVNDSSVYVYFDVNERDLLMLLRKWPRIDSEASDERDKPNVYLQLADETDFPHEGRIDYADSKVDTSTGTLRVRAIFKNETGILMPGLFTRVRVPISNREALVLPELAVGIGQAGRYVLLVGKDNVVEQRLVRTGPLEGTMRVIEEGISSDDWVVINGLQRARPGAKVIPKKSTISPVQESEQATKPNAKSNGR